MTGHDTIRRLNDRDRPNTPKYVNLLHRDRIAGPDDKKPLAGWNGRRLRDSLARHRLSQRLGKPTRADQKIGPLRLRGGESFPDIALRSRIGYRAAAGVSAQSVINRNGNFDAKAGNGSVNNDTVKVRNGGRDKRVAIGNRIHFRCNMPLQAGIDLLEQNCTGRNQRQQFLRAAAGFICLAITTAEIDAEDGRRIRERCTHTVKPDRNLGRQPAPGKGGGGVERSGQIIGKNQQHQRDLYKSCNVLHR
ncbi:hypothetical protein D3C86_1518400 [compost metagenome]